MRTYAVTAAVSGVLLVLVGQTTGNGPARHPGATESTLAAVSLPPRPAPPLVAPSSADVSPAALTAVVQRYCQVCHNSQLLTGNLSLEGFDVAAVPQQAETAEKMIKKLRAGMMP